MQNNLVIMALFAAVIVTSGCIDQAVDERTPEEGFQDFEQSEETSSQEIDRTIEIKAFGDNSFNKNNIEVEQGQTVEFLLTNNGGTHDLVIPGLNTGTEIITGGETDSFTYTFNETGEFRFECSVGTHAQQGMTGTITVS